MKLIIERDKALAVLARVAGVVERSNTIPILGNTLVEAEGAVVRFTATDLDMEAAGTIAANVERPGAVTLEAARLLEIVRTAPTGADIQINLDQGEPRAGVQYARSRFKVPTLPAADFPVMAPPDASTTIVVNGPVLAWMFDQTASSMSADTTKYPLYGVHLHEYDDAGERRLRLVATNTHRLAHAQIDMPDGVPAFAGVTLPRKAVGEIHRMLGDFKGPVTLQLAKNKFAIEIGDTVLTSKVIDYPFPDYQRVVPRDHPHSLRVDRSLLTQAIKRCSIASEADHPAFRMNITAGRLVISAREVGFAEATEEVEAEFDGPETELGFSVKLFTDMLGKIASEVVRLEFKDNASPMLALNAQEPRALQLLMPFRV